MAKKKSKGLEPSKELLMRVKATEALQLTHVLLHKGSFHFKQHHELNQAIAFITSLHAQSLALALKDPQADLIPSLKAIKDQEKISE